MQDSALSTEKRKLLLKVHGEQKIVILITPCGRIAELAVGVLAPRGKRDRHGKFQLGIMLLSFPSLECSMTTPP